MSILKLDCDQEYRLNRLIARGGMGSVYEAEQVGEAGFAKRVAIKMIRKRLADNPEFIERFVAEANVAADLVHPNIVQVQNLKRAGGEYFIVMEYVEGVTLDRYLARHLDQTLALPVDLAAFMVGRMCRALDYAHREAVIGGRQVAVVHRDICPRNVLVSFAGEVKISDFGIARAAHLVEPRQRQMMGRIEYMAPEQARGEAPDGRCDIYSAGVVLYELIAGQVPERGSGSLERLLREGSARPRRLREVRPEVPEELDAIVLRALEPDPEARYPSAGNMATALERYLASRGTPPGRETLADYLGAHFSKPEPWSRNRHPTAIDTPIRGGERGPQRPGKSPK